MFLSCLFVCSLSLLPDLFAPISFRSRDGLSWETETAYSLQ